MIFKLFLFLCLIAGAIYCITESLVCHGDVFEQICANGTLEVSNATLGRWGFNKCRRTNYGFPDCSVDVTDFLEKKCNKTAYCRVEVSDIIEEFGNPCNIDFSPYLVVMSECKLD